MLTGITGCGKNDSKSENNTVSQQSNETASDTQETAAQETTEPQPQDPAKTLFDEVVRNYGKLKNFHLEETFTANIANTTTEKNEGDLFSIGNIIVSKKTSSDFSFSNTREVRHSKASTELKIGAAGESKTNSNSESYREKNSTTMNEYKLYEDKNVWFKNIGGPVNKSENDWVMLPDSVVNLSINEKESKDGVTMIDGEVPLKDVFPLKDVALVDIGKNSEKQNNKVIATGTVKFKLKIDAKKMIPLEMKVEQKKGNKEQLTNDTSCESFKIYKKFTKIDNNVKVEIPKEVRENTTEQSQMGGLFVL